MKAVDSIMLASDPPLYWRVYRVIAEQIERGSLGPRDRLPTERALSEKLDVSRATVRRALQELANNGLIEAAQGRGYHVRPAHVSEPPNTLISFSAMGAARGLRASSRVLGSDLRPATIDEAVSLGLAPGGAVFDLLRVRLLDDVPIAVTRSRISHARVPGIESVDFCTASLFALLEERWGIVPTRADYAVEAVAAADREAELLDVEPGAPMLFARDATYDQYGAVCHLGELTYRGDRYRFEATLVRAPA